jgi:hypothetical protein
MILTVLMLGGTLLGATTIAGLLMLFQVRQAADIASSAKAFFAADSGIEWAWYQFIHGYNEDETTPLPGTTVVIDGQEVGVLSNGSRVRKPTCIRTNEDPIICTKFLSGGTDPPNFDGGYIQSRGEFGGTVRGFKREFFVR